MPLELDKSSRSFVVAVARIGRLFKCQVGWTTLKVKSKIYMQENASRSERIGVMTNWLSWSQILYSVV